jgi:hypothetical protein
VGFLKPLKTERERERREKREEWEVVRAITFGEVRHYISGF